MKNLLRNRTVVGVACIVLSLIICFGLTPLYNGALNAKTEIVRITKDIGKGELITAAMVQKVEVGKFNLPDSVLKDQSNVVGKYAKADFSKGDYFLSSKVSDTPLVNYEYLYDFVGKERAISVSIKSFAAGLSGKLEQGDIVSLYVSDYGEAKETLNPSELQYVQVLAVTAPTGLDTSEYQENQVNAIEDEKELPSTITLKVSPEQAKLLAELEVKGKIHVVFVYRGSQENAQKFLEEQNKVLNSEDEKAIEESFDAMNQQAEMNESSGSSEENPSSVQTESNVQTEGGVKYHE
ncbi:Flp pilus assembly protein CpaB [Anaerosolibacter sp.]|uniref:Flp pilus assembly protein CpaB n=1 Tax=Anaerosolibacter sp. TaxID=1872527 RepID=UPI0039F131E5